MNFAQQPIDRSRKDDPMATQMREQMAESAKSFKISWITLGQGLFTIHRDKLYHAWGFDKFEDYVVKELGLTKAVANRLVKNYAFIETEEPVYLKKEFSEARDTIAVPGIEGVDVLRMAHRTREVSRDDYMKYRKEIFENGADPAEVRKDLTTLIKERKKGDPDEERDMRHQASVRKFMSALKSFKKDMEVLNLMDPKLMEQTDKLLEELLAQYQA